MFGEKSPGKMHNVYWYRSYTQTFLLCFFIFTSFNTTSLILLIKHIFTSKLLLSEKVTNPCRIILVCSLAGVNALA